MIRMIYKEKICHKKHIQKRDQASLSRLERFFYIHVNVPSKVIFLKMNAKSTLLMFTDTRQIVLFLQSDESENRI